MKTVRLITALLLVLLMAVGNPLTALAASWDVTDSEGVSNAFATDTDAEVIINMQNDINMDTSLVANEGQNYVINGNGNTISDVVLSGEGSVDINANVTSEDNYAALDVFGQADVTVEGDVTGEYTGVYAGEESTVTVVGNVTADEGVAVDASNSEVTVTGDVSGEYAGVSANEDSTVTVEGNVTAENGNAVHASNSEVTVTGDVAGDYTGVYAGEESTVTVVGNVTADEGVAVDASNSEVTVTGDVASEYTGIYADEESTVTVEGNVTAENGNAVHASNSEVTVTGDVAGYYSGISANEDSTVTVNGNVTSNNGNAIDTWINNVEDSGSNQDGAEDTTEDTIEDPVVTVVGDVSSSNGAAINASSGTVEVTGNVTGYAGIVASGDAAVNVTGDVAGVDAVDSEMGYIGTGVYAYENAEVTVDGNVSGGDGYLTEEELQDPLAFSDGGVGVSATDEAVVTVTGDVSGGDSMGTFGYGGNGVNADGEAAVTVEGNVTGGDVIADPTVEAQAEKYVIDAEGNTQTYYPQVSEGGNAVSVNYGATVTVGGNATGGSTNGDHGNGGNGILLTNNTMNEDAEIETGSVTVKGTVSGGTSGTDGESGAAVYYRAWNGYLPGTNLEEILEKPVRDLTDNEMNVLAIAFSNLMMNGDLTEEEFFAYLDEVTEQVTEDMADEEIISLYAEMYQKVISQEASDLENLVEEIPEYAKVTVGVLSDKNGPAVNSDVGEEAAEEYAKANITETAPPTGSNPKTGDDFNGMLLITLMSLSLLGIGILLPQRKRIE